MSILKGIIEPENAIGTVKEIYDIVENRYGFIPNSIKMNSINPTTIKLIAQMSDYFMDQSSLSDKFRLITNLLIAKNDKSEYCSTLLREILINNLKMNDEEIDTLLKDPMQAPLEKKDLALLEFILKVLKDSNSTSEADITKLNDLDITDLEIYDALNFATQMQKYHVMLNALKIEKD